jgi:hypothetical protein
MNVYRELKQDENGDDVRLLHTSLLLLDPEVPSRERNQARFGVGTAEVITRLQRACGLEPSGIVDPATSAAIEKALEGKRYRVTGTLRSTDRAGVGGLGVVIVDRNIDRRVALAETHTDPAGRYEAYFSARRLVECCKAKPDLQAHVYVGGTLLATSATLYNATQSEVTVSVDCHGFPRPLRHRQVRFDPAQLSRLASQHAMQLPLQMRRLGSSGRRRRWRPYYAVAPSRWIDHPPCV